MVNVILHGACGVMGSNVIEVANKDDEINIVAGIDNSEKDLGFPIYKSLLECKEEADVVIDFSVAGAIDKLLDDAVEKNIPIVLCTTGLSDETLSHMKSAEEKIAILKSANMSIGVNLLLDILKPVTKSLKDLGYDIEIIEKHHNRKLDAPSGTALALADSINEASDGKYEYCYDRHERNLKRPENEIGISSLRAGNIAGEHEVIFAGVDEQISFKHVANSRMIFASGALKAAKFLKGKEKGHYEMSDALK